MSRVVKNLAVICQALLRFFYTLSDESDLFTVHKLDEAFFLRGENHSTSHQISYKLSWSKGVVLVLKSSITEPVVSASRYPSILNDAAAVQGPKDHSVILQCHQEENNKMPL